MWTPSPMTGLYKKIKKIQIYAIIKLCLHSLGIWKPRKVVTGEKCDKVDIPEPTDISTYLSL